MRPFVRQLLQRLIGLAILSGTAVLPVAAQYTVIDLHDFLPAEATDSFAFGVSGNNVVGGGVGNSPGGNQNPAWAWNLSTHSATDISASLPPGFNVAVSQGVSGNGAVGFQGVNFGGGLRAVYWDVATNTATDLHGQFLTDLGISIALGISENTAVGWMRTNVAISRTHAFAFNLTTNVGTDLHPLVPATFIQSEAHAVSGDNVVGFAHPSSFNRQAFVWNLAAQTAANLHALLPGTPVWSTANGVFGDNVVGVSSQSAFFSTQSGQAVYWNLSNNSVMDLHALLPDTFAHSIPKAVNADTAVGFGVLADEPNSLRALLWNLLTGVTVDLEETYLAPLGFSNTEVHGIDANGTIVGSGTRNGSVHAFALILNGSSNTAPEPSSSLLVVFGFGILAIRVARRTLGPLRRSTARDEAPPIRKIR